REEPVRDRIAALANAHRRRLAALAEVPGVATARQLGTIAAVDLPGGEGGYLSDRSPRLLRFFRERDLLLRPLGTTVYVMPPYFIEDDDLDAIYAAI
ncbi:hypothetical protein ACTGUZ_11350, partial [Streptococcus suis]